MLNQWDYYSTTPSTSLCDVCHCYGHWSYECSFSPQYSTSSYNTQWEGPSFGRGYEDHRVSAYDQNFQDHEFYQPSQYQHVENESSMHDKLDMMIGILEEMRQGTRQRQEQNNEETLPFPAQYSNRPEGLCLPKQSLMVGEQNLEPEADCLRLPKQNPLPEPHKPIYTEQDYALEFDDFSEVDETEEIDSTRENKEVEMSNKEIEEARDSCKLPSQLEVSSEPIEELVVKDQKVEQGVSVLNSSFFLSSPLPPPIQPTPPQQDFPLESFVTPPLYYWTLMVKGFKPSPYG